MKLADLHFKPKYQKIHIYEDFYILLERMTKPELNKIVRNNTVLKGDNEVEIKTVKVKTPNGFVEVSGISVALAKKIKGWEGLTGKILKQLLPDLEVNIDDEEEIEYDATGAILLVAYGSIPSDDGSYKQFEEVLMDHVNSIVSNIESEVEDTEKK